jgi:hypothetical protein
VDAFSVVIDHAQTRITRDRLFTLVTGRTDIDEVTGKQIDGWSERGDADASGDLKCWVEPVTGKLMLRPAPLSRGWQTTATGIYARIKKANLTLPTAAAWEDNEFTNQAAVSVAMKDKSASEEAVTSTSYPVNRPFYIAPVFFASGTDNRGYIDCGWGSAGAGIAVRFYASGWCEIRKAGTLVFTGSWAGSFQGAPQKANGERVGFFMFPIPPNELLIVTQWGGGLSHKFGDLDPTDPDGIVTAAGTFRFQCVDMGTDVELAPIKFNSSGYIDSIPAFFGAAPEAGATPTIEKFEWQPGYGTWTNTTTLIYTDSSGAFVPDGVLNEVRFRSTFTSDGDATPYVQAVTAAFPAVQGSTPDEELDITEYVTELRLTAAMDPGSTRAIMTLKSPDTINDLDPSGSRRIVSTENRPVTLRLGSLTVLDGVGDRPSWDDSTSDDTERVFAEVRDKWKLLEDCRFTDLEPLDGLTLTDAVTLLAESAGIDLIEISPDADTITIEVSSRISERDFATPIENRDTAAEIVKRLHEQYVPDWYLGIRPTLDGNRFELRSPADMGELPLVSIYPEYAQAVTELADPPTSFLYHKFNQQSPPTEFTRLYVHGRDPRTGRPIVGTAYDYAREDPTLAAADRTDEWTGMPRKAALQCSYLRSQDAVDRAAAAIWRRAGFRRFIGEWECEMLIDPETGLPLWVGDCVELAGQGVFRIQSLDIPLNTEPISSADTARRRARYLGEKIVATRDDSTGLGHSRQRETSLPELVLGWKKVREPAQPFESRPPSNVAL